MKKIYILVLTFISITAIAQQSISFETPEGFQLGTIHEQNEWGVTIANDNLVENQKISDEKASEGNFSFKNAYEPTINSAPLPVIGAYKNFDTPLTYNNFTISYDVLATAKLGSNFEFAIFALDENDAFQPVAGVGLKNSGVFYVIKDINYGIDDTTTEWVPNEWINVKIEVSTTEIKYYINNVLAKTYANFSLLDVAGINILHDNFGADAYYDNIVITSENLSTNLFEEVSYSVYPNPSQNTISIALPTNVEVSEAAIYSIAGQKVLQTSYSQNIDISQLAIGTYFLKGNTADGTSFTKKIIKN